MFFKKSRFCEQTGKSTQYKKSPYSKKGGITMYDNKIRCPECGENFRLNDHIRIFYEENNIGKRN